MLFELCIALGVIVIIFPFIYGTFKTGIQTFGMVQGQQQHLAERIDIYSRLLSDSQLMTSLDSNCCMSTTMHNICYDIKNNRFRRGKKQFNSRVYYRHYIGKGREWQTITCTYHQNNLSILLESERDKLEMDFYVPL